MPLLPLLMYFERSKRFARLEHLKRVAENNMTPLFRMLLCRSTERSRDGPDNRRGSLDKKHLPVEVAVERPAALLCSHTHHLEP